MALGDFPVQFESRDEARDRIFHARLKIFKIDEIENIQPPLVSVEQVRKLLLLPMIHLELALETLSLTEREIEVLKAPLIAIDAIGADRKTRNANFLKAEDFDVGSKLLDRILERVPDGMKIETILHSYQEAISENINWGVALTMSPNPALRAVGRAFFEDLNKILPGSVNLQAL